MRPKTVNDTFCPYDCEGLQIYGKEEYVTARCKITGRDLVWYDFWIATECSFIVFLENEEEVWD